MLWVSLLAGMLDMSGAPAQVIEPNSYAQERYVLSTAPRVLFSSRVGRGKSFIACAKEHIACCALPGMVSAVTRLERVSMENTTLETLRTKIIPGELWAGGRDYGWKASESVFRYPPVRCDDGVVRQSRIHIFGWLDPGRALSAEYGRIVVDQAEQLERRHYTVALTRLRQNDAWINARAKRLGISPRQLSLIVNPEDDEHWIAKEFDPERGMRVESTPEGRDLYEVILSSFHDNESNLPDDYQENLESLKGTVYYDRLVLGKWARAEGSVFPMWDASRHVVRRPAEWAEWGGYPPPTWPRYRGIDFGYRNPFVCLWAAQSPEGRFYVYREWSMAERLAEDHARVILQAEADELAALRQSKALEGNEDAAYNLKPYLDALYIRGSYADHDAEDAATLARYGVRSTPAKKDIHGAIRSIASHLNRGTLLVVDDSLMEEDALQVAQKQPTSLAREVAGYRWQSISETKNPVDDRREKPIDARNHRIDSLGYILFTLERAVRPSVTVAA